MNQQKSSASNYQPLKPANNLILQKKWDQTTYNLHRAKVRDAKGMTDTKPPNTYMHLHLKLKKIQMEQDRQAIIDRDNGLLLEKMASIMRTTGTVDNKNEYRQRSLNVTQRQRDLLKVNHENQAILKRIQRKEPNYSHMQWSHQWRLNQQYMTHMSKFTHPWLHHKGKKSKIALQPKIKDEVKLQASTPAFPGPKAAYP